MIDFKGVKKRDNLTVEVPLLVPVAELPTLLTFYNYLVVPNGATISEQARNPVGTGPFKFVSFTPGTQSTFAANPHYWQSGLPYVDKLVVNSSFTDSTAQMDALLAGDIDVFTQVPYTLAKENASNSQIRILNSAGSNWYQVCMRINHEPFTDVRVRQAMRLIADRPEIVAAGLDGYGTIGNDLEGDYCEHFASQLHRSQDIDQAKSLLKAAGKSDLTVTLPVAAAAPGLLESATVYAQQAKAAGVTVKLQTVSASSYFTPAGGYLSRPFGLDYCASSWPSLTMTYRAQFTKSAPYNDTAWGFQPGGAAAGALLAQAIAELNPAKAEQLWYEVQLQQFNEGGSIDFAQANYVDAIATNVQGLQTTKAGYLNDWHLLGAWFS
jgi:peptide/nickel transport system substrate-binding protein